MADEKNIMEEVKQKIAEDEEILREVRSDISLLTEVRYRILKRKLHNQLMDLVEDSVENKKVQINSIEDLLTVIELDLLLR